MYLTKLDDILDVLWEHFWSARSGSEYFVRWGLIELNNLGYINIAMSESDECVRRDVTPEEMYMPYVYAMGLLRLHEVSIEARANNYHACDTDFAEYVPFLEEAIPPIVLGQFYAKACELGKDKDDQKMIDEFDGDAVIKLLRLIKDDICCIGLECMAIALNMDCPELIETVERYDEETEGCYEENVVVYSDFEGFCRYLETVEFDDVIKLWSYDDQMYMEWLGGNNIFWT